MNNPELEIVESWNAFSAPTEQITLSEAVGRVAASTIRQYPPGIPEIIPGMRYTPQILNNLETAHKSGIEIIGVNMSGKRNVEVVETGQQERHNLDIKTFDAKELSDLVINEIADFFRLGFSGAPYFHFAFHESDPLQSLPHTLDYAAYTVSLGLSDSEKRKTCQETLREIGYQKAMSTQSAPGENSTNLPKGFHLWTDKEICRKQIRDRISDEGYVTLVRDVKTDKLLGLLHARMGSLERLFQSEEWSDPLLFSQYQNRALRDNPERFFKKVDYHFGLKPYDQLMTISAQILHPDIQGGDIFYKMMRSMAEEVRPEHAALPLLSEIPPHGTAHTLNTALNDRLVFGVLKNDHPVVFCSQMSQALFLITRPKSYWNSALRQQIKKAREYRTKYYETLPTDNENVSVRPNGQMGLGVFATGNIPGNSRIAIFTGEKYQSETALGLPEIMRDHAIQIGQKEYVFGYKGLAHRLCHSCNPNCGIRNLTEIFTIRDVLAGEELTWDYRCSENSNWVLENCLCACERCTGKVANFESLPPEIKAEYLSKSMVSEWIVQTLSENQDPSTSSAV